MTDAEIIEDMARAMFDAVAEREKSLTRWDAAEPDARLLALFCARAALAICAPAIRAQAMAKAARLRKALTGARETILDLKNSRWSEAEGTDEEWVAEIDAALAPPAVAEKGESA